MYGPEKFTFVIGPKKSTLKIHQRLLLKGSAYYEDMVKKDPELEEIRVPHLERATFYQFRKWVYADSTEVVQNHFWTEKLYKGRDGVKNMIKLYLCANK